MEYNIIVGQTKTGTDVIITPRLVCGECRLQFDCEYNLNKHREIVHLFFLQ